MAKRLSKRRHLTVYLIKQHIRDYSDALVSSTALEAHPLRTDLPFRGSIFVQAPTPHDPLWAEFLEDGVDDDIVFGRNTTTAAVLFVKSARRMFALTFGHARHLLRPDSFERDFGLRVVVNRVAPDKLRSVNLKTLGELPISRQEQASAAAKIGAFGIDVRQDLLRAVSGIPSEKAFGEQVTGSDSLIIAVRLEFRDLGDKCKELFQAYNDDAYKGRGFGWIDNLRVVRDPSTRQELDAKLLAALRRKTPAGVQMMPPDHAGHAGYVEFSYTRDPDRGAHYTTLDVHEWRATLADSIGTITVDDLRSQKVCAYTADKGEADARFDVYDCLSFETTLHGERFVLAHGDWFEVATEFDEEIKAYIAGISNCSLGFCEAEAGANEGDYIDRAAVHQPALLRLHTQEKFRVNGSEVEPCDMLHADGHLIHVKCWTQSSTFSHLLSQGAVSAETLLREPQYRADVQNAIGKLRPELVDFLPADGFSPGNFEVVYALVRRGDGDLPFFSRLNLMRHGERVQRLGYRVAYVRVPVR